MSWQMALSVSQVKHVMPPLDPGSYAADAEEVATETLPRGAEQNESSASPGVRPAATESTPRHTVMPPNVTAFLHWYVILANTFKYQAFFNGGRFRQSLVNRFFER